MHSFLTLIGNIYKLSGVGGPFAAWLQLHNVHNFSLATDQATSRLVFIQDIEVVRWEKGDLLTPKFVTEDVVLNGDFIGRQINDRLWNAFGFSNARIYDESGELH